MSGLSQEHWKGVFSAMTTPFASDGSIDVSLVERLVDTLIGDGVDGLIVAGSTGEFYSQSMAERLELFELVKRCANDRVMLIAGTSALSRADTISLTEGAKRIGYDGCMVLPPFYCIPTESEVYGYFAELAEIGLPVMIYNNPARVGVSISPSLANQLADIENIVAYKESARDIYTISETYYATKDRMNHFAGLEPYGAALISRGAVGIVSTISNVCARDVVNYYKAICDGDRDAMQRTQRIIDQIYHLLKESGLSNFAFVKGAMAAIGRPGGICRLPHRMPNETEIERIRESLNAIYNVNDKTVPESA